MKIPEASFKVVDFYLPEFIFICVA